MNEIIIHATQPHEAVAFVKEILSWGVDPLIATVSFNPAKPDQKRYPLIVSGRVHDVESQMKVSGITVGDASESSFATLQILTLLGFDVKSEDILTNKKQGEDGHILINYIL